LVYTLLLNTLHNHSTWTASSSNKPPDTVPFGDVPRWQRG